MDIQHSTTPWYKQFWPWFIFGLPGTVVIAGVITIWIAATNDVHLVKENYYQDGLDINVEIRQKKAAALLNVKANILFSEQDKQVSIFLTGEATPPKTLTLVLSAPINTSHDHKITLKSQNSNLYKGVLSKPINGRYYLSLLPDNREWRLAQEITLPKQDPITILNSDGNAQ